MFSFWIAFGISVLFVFLFVIFRIIKLRAVCINAVLLLTLGFAIYYFPISPYLILGGFIIVSFLLGFILKSGGKHIEEMSEDEDFYASKTRGEEVPKPVAQAVAVPSHTVGTQSQRDDQLLRHQIEMELKGKMGAQIRHDVEAEMKAEMDQHRRQIEVEIKMRANEYLRSQMEAERRARVEEKQQYQAEIQRKKAEEERLRRELELQLKINSDEKKIRELEKEMRVKADEVLRSEREENEKKSS